MTMQGVLKERATTELAAVTKYLETRYTGGTPFFDALDEELRDAHWFRYLILRYLDEYPSRARPVVSGKFGEAFARWFSTSEYARYIPFPLVLPGELRHSQLPPLDADFNGMELVFLDDSYYRGRTYSQITRRTEDAGARMLGALVLYDGSPTPPVVPSFFRYHHDV